MPYEWHEHTSDIRVRISASTLEELFSDALHAMTELLGPELIERCDKKTCRMSLQADDPTSLLIDFLNEALLLTLTEKTAYLDITLEKLTGNEISAVLCGIPYFSLRRDIKAVTYHEADVKMNTGGKWETTIVFDL